jgi:hypothetical protein
VERVRRCERREKTEREKSKQKIDLAFDPLPLFFLFLPKTVRHFTFFLKRFSYLFLFGTMGTIGDMERKKKKREKHKGHCSPLSLSLSFVFLLSALSLPLRALSALSDPSLSIRRATVSMRALASSIM